MWDGVRQEVSEWYGRSRYIKDHIFNSWEISKILKISELPLALTLGLQVFS